MISKELNILNGDAIVPIFTSTFPNSTFLVWREALCQGPLMYEIEDPSFRTLRLKFLNACLSANAEVHLVEQLEKINLHEFNEVILWFEYDVFCQVNFMAAVSWILQKRPEIKIAMLDLLPYQKKDFVGLGHIAKDEYPSIFSNRILLSFAEKKYIDFCWNKISAKDFQLLSFLKDFKNLKKFNGAIRTIAVFSNDNGLGAAWIEAKLIDILKTKSHTKRNLVGKVLQISAELGYGDIQIAYIINKEIKRGRLIEKDNSISLP